MVSQCKTWCKRFFTHDMTFTLSFIGACISCGFGKIDVHFIDAKVLLSLFGLMLTIEALKAKGSLRLLAQHFVRIASTQRRLVQYLVALSFVASMLLTNDVTILTVLPIFLMIARSLLGLREAIIGTILIILAANLGSSAFPTGSPHNIVLYTHYQLQLGQFLMWMLPFQGLSAIFLYVLSLSIPATSIQAFTQLSDQASKKFLPYISLLILIAYTTNFLHGWYWVVLASVLVLIQFPKAIKSVDYFLLMTFVCFFLIVGNFSQSATLADFLRESVQNYRQTLWVSAFVSQVISNVPAAILLAPFTDKAQAMVIGANIGGMGTLIASLANLIGYKIFLMYYAQEKLRLFIWFSVVNFALFFVFLCIFSFLS